MRWPAKPPPTRTSPQNHSTPDASRAAACPRAPGARDCFAEYRASLDDRRNSSKYAGFAEKSGCAPILGRDTATFSARPTSARVPRSRRDYAQDAPSHGKRFASRALRGTRASADMMRLSYSKKALAGERALFLNTGTWLSSLSLTSSARPEREAPDRRRAGRRRLLLRQLLSWPPAVAALSAWRSITMTALISR